MVLMTMEDRTGCKYPRVQPGAHIWISCFFYQTCMSIDEFSYVYNIFRYLDTYMYL